MKFRELSRAASLVAAVALAPVPARALDAVAFEIARPEQAAASARARSEDDDEDAFFSGGRRGPTVVTGSIGSAALQRSAPRARMDVAAICRALMADEPNSFNVNVVERCQRKLAEAATRRR